MSIDNRIVRIKFWQQETVEFGRWVQTEPMTYDHAENLISIGAYERPTIIEEQP